MNKEAYRYPGPRPQSRETALVMLADGVEARSRAERPENEEAIRALVKDVIDKRLEMGQLDDTPLTMSDLTTISESFTTTLRGVFHPRIQYPKPDEDTRPSEGDFPEKNHDISLSVLDGQVTLQINSDKGKNFFNEINHNNSFGEAEKLELERIRLMPKRRSI